MTRVAMTQRSEAEQIRRYFNDRFDPIDLAEEARVSRQYVSAIIRGREPASEKVVAAARRMGIIG